MVLCPPRRRSLFRQGCHEGRSIRSYAARQLARDVVARGWADACEVRVAYAIGVAEPVAISFETFGTTAGASPGEQYAALGIDIATLLRPGRIMERLGLTQPIFRKAAAFGHFGPSTYPWETPLTS